MQRPGPILILFALAVLALASIACNLQTGIPVTPTLIPVTPSPTALALLPSLTPSETFTPTATDTNVPTETSTLTPTATHTQAVTSTYTSTPTVMPSDTSIPTQSPSDTPRPSDTPAPTSIPTVTVTPLPTQTLPPLPSPTSIPLPTLIPSRTDTPLPLPTLVALGATDTITPFPTLPPPPTQIPLPTTAPIVGSPVPVAPFTPTAVALAATPQPQNDFGGGNSVNIGVGTIQFPPIDGAGRIALDFDSHPSGKVAVIDQSGNMTINGVPYTANGKHAGKRFVTARWSPDGRWLAYVIETPGAEGRQLGWRATLDDGLWLLDTAAPSAPPQFIYQNHYDEPFDTQLRIVRDIVWAPDNFAIMLTVQWPRGLKSVLVGTMIRHDQQGNGLFDLIDYVNGTWQPDSQGYVAASPPGDHPAVMGVVHRDIGVFTKLADGAALGLWIQNPAQLADGRYAFLGKPSPSGTLINGATGLALYVMPSGGVPVAVSPALPGEVISAVWNPGRTALLVTLRSGQGIQAVVVTIDGRILDYSGRARGSAALHWTR